MRRKISDWKTLLTALCAALLCGALPLTAAASVPETLIPMGNAVGIRMQMDGVRVVGTLQFETESGYAAPAGDAGVRSGDIIRTLNGREIRSTGDFLTEASEMDGSPVEMIVERDGQTVFFSMTPARNRDGAFQLGVWLRDSVSGIGTMTYYDPETHTYGALGHGIGDAETGTLMDIGSGEICRSEIVDVVRGEVGTPGELCGKNSTEEVLGSIERNTDRGIFGTLNDYSGGTPIPVAEKNEVILGDASILTNVDGQEVREYQAEICRIYRDPNDLRSVLVAITDPALLTATGGIVQGMSGSPILQNGKLIGAVTHVLINDPTRGYGICIEDMLNAAA